MDYTKLSDHQLTALQKHIEIQENMLENEWIAVTDELGRRKGKLWVEAFRKNFGITENEENFAKLVDSLHVSKKENR